MLVWWHASSAWLLVLEFLTPLVVVVAIVLVIVSLVLVLVASSFLAPLIATLVSLSLHWFCLCLASIWMSTMSLILLFYVSKYNCNYEKKSN